MFARLIMIWLILAFLSFHFPILAPVVLIVGIIAFLTPAGLAQPGGMARVRRYLARWNMGGAGVRARLTGAVIMGLGGYAVFFVGLRELTPQPVPSKILIGMSVLLVLYALELFRSISTESSP